MVTAYDCHRKWMLQVEKQEEHTFSFRLTCHNIRDFYVDLLGLNSLLWKLLAFTPQLIRWNSFELSDFIECPSRFIGYHSEAVCHGYFLECFIYFLVCTSSISHPIANQDEPCLVFQIQLSSLLLLTSVPSLFIPVQTSDKYLLSE